MGAFERLKPGLRKTTQLLNTDVRDLFKAGGRLVDEAFLDELFEILIKTDMGVQAAQATVDEIRRSYQGRVVQMSDVLVHVKRTLKELMARRLSKP